MGNNRKFKHRSGDEGYTLLELLVVLAILALLATFAAPAVLKYLGSAKEDVAGVQLENLAAALNLYRLEVGDYPDTNDGLQALLTAPKDAVGWNGALPGEGKRHHRSLGHALCLQEAGHRPPL